MSYLGADEVVEPVEPLVRVEARLMELQREFRAAEQRRKWATLFAVGGAIFAAFRLGIVAVPEIKRHRDEWRAKRQLAANPRRRRR